MYMEVHHQKDLTAQDLQAIAMHKQEYNLEEQHTHKQLKE